MSVPDIDVWRSAKLLVDCYGDGASLHAVNRCDGYCQTKILAIFIIV